MISLSTLMLLPLCFYLFPVKQIQWWKNGGKCGICGDRYDLLIRDNEPPNGRFAKGIITETYYQGDTINISVQITASHKGYFQFRLCSNNNPQVVATQACLDNHLLAEYQGNATKIYVDDTNVGFYNITMRLPPDVTCSQCVLQWRYRTGNRWGCLNNDFEKGPCGLGYGYQEEFYACSDIAIVQSQSTTVTTRGPTSSTSSTTPPTTHVAGTSPSDIPVATGSTFYTTSTTMMTTSSPSVKIICKSAGAWTGSTTMDAWCDINCKSEYCPLTHCKCAPEGKLVDDSAGLLGSNKDCFSLAGDPDLDKWCKFNCPQGFCDQNTCFCVTLN